MYLLSRAALSARHSGAHSLEALQVALLAPQGSPVQQAGWDFAFPFYRKESPGQDRYHSGDQLAHTEIGAES